jgi:hypothetical protein
LESLGIENVVIFYDLLKYFTAISYNLQPFGIVCGLWYIFSVLVCLNQEKSGNPDGTVRLFAKTKWSRKCQVSP